MTLLMRYYPGDRALEGLLVVALGAALASSVACLISRRLAGRAAQRHLVLLAGLICCLATPALAWLFAAAHVKLVSIPLLGSEQGRGALAVRLMETDPFDVRLAWDLLRMVPM